MLNAGTNNLYVCKSLGCGLMLLIVVTALPFMKSGFANVVLIAEGLHTYTRSCERFQQ